MIYELSGSLDKEPQIQRAIQLTFAKKFAATLHKRTMSFWKLFRFHADKGYRSGLDFTEASIFVYFEDLKQRSKPTAPQAGLEALCFFHALLRLKVQLNDLVSHRLGGLVFTASIEKRPLLQARALTADEVKWLELLVLKSLDTAIVCVAGFFLFAISNCARWGDAQNAALPTLDESAARSVISSETKRHKLANAAQRKTMLLPYVAFGRLLAWAKPWLEATQRVRD